MRYATIYCSRHAYSVQLMRRCLGVSRSRYYGCARSAPVVGSAAMRALSNA